MEQINFVYSNPAKKGAFTPSPTQESNGGTMHLKQEGEPAIQCGPPALATLAMLPAASQATCVLCFICAPHLRG